MTVSRIKVDIARLAGLFVVATLLVIMSAPVAQLIGEPAYAPWLLFAGLALYGVALSHILRRVLFPYIDLREFALTAQLHPVGSGIVFLGVCIVLSAFVSLMGNVVRAEELPANAKLYLPMLKGEQLAWWVDMPQPSALAAQVEQETCVSLKSARCWSPRAELRTSRERGVGLGQITRTARFDALSEMVSSNKTALSGWGWDSANLYDPRYQLRALVLKDKQGWSVIHGAASDSDRLAFAFASYNGGIGGVMSDRKLCQATRGCDAGRWFGHVERTSLKKKTAVAGYGKSFFEVNREYVRNVLVVRRPRYAHCFGDV
jgi:hypothetical protein